MRFEGTIVAAVERVAKRSTRSTQAGRQALNDCCSINAPEDFRNSNLRMMQIFGI